MPDTVHIVRPRGSRSRFRNLDRSATAAQGAVYEIAFAQPPGVLATVAADDLAAVAS